MFTGIGSFTKHACVLRAEKATVLNGPLIKVGEITYPNFEVHGVAKSILPLNRLDVGEGEKAIPARYH